MAASRAKGLPRGSVAAGQNVGTRGAAAVPERRAGHISGNFGRAAATKPFASGRLAKRGKRLALRGPNEAREGPGAAFMSDAARATKAVTKSASGSGNGGQNADVPRGLSAFCETLALLFVQVRRSEYLFSALVSFRYFVD